MATFYIDPTYPVNGTGTSSDPFNVWPSIASSNVYLQKRGTTANTQSAAVTAFGRSNVTIGAYGTGPNPVINAGTAIGLQCSNSSNLTIEGVDFVSTHSYGVIWVGGNGISITDSIIVGARCGLSITSSSTSGVAGATLTRVTARHTVVANEQSGLFMAAANATYNLTNIKIIDCTFSNNARLGAQIKSGDGNVSAQVNGLLIKGCDISNNAAGGILINTGGTTFAEDKFATNVVFEGNTVKNNRFEGAALSIRGGRNRVCYNTIEGNQKFSDTNLSASGGMSISGSTNVDVYGTVSRNNGSGGRPYDGVGIYLDVVAFLPDLGTNNSRIFNNVSIGNNEYSPDAANIASSMLSSGIGVYKSYNNIITGNVCLGNGAGICAGAWTSSNRIYNNTLVGNKYGIVQLWNATSPGNTIRNNIIKDSTSHAFAAPPLFTFATTGDITLSGTTGTVTCTSTAADFPNASYFNYAIIAGGGVGWVVSKQSNTQITIVIISAFSGTTFSNGNWSLSAGEDQGIWPGYSALFGNAAGAYAGTGQSLTEGSNNVTADPRVFSDGSIASNSPCATTGLYASGIPLVNGRLRPGYVPIGSYMAVQPRTPRT
jgi:parallel beta-helix repeat protein